MKRNLVWLSLVMGLTTGWAWAGEPGAGAAAAVSPAAQNSSPAQPTDIETLFNRNTIYAHGGYGGPGFKLTYLDGKPEFMAGGRIAYIMNHEFLLGVGGYGLVSNDVQRTLNGENRSLRMGYGGLEFGYVFASNAIMHLTLQTLIGGGAIGYEYKTDHWDKDHWEYDFQGSDFFVVEPMVYMELNLTRWCRACWGAGYRLAAGVDENIVGLNSRALGGASVEMLFKFGLF